MKKKQEIKCPSHVEEYMTHLKDRKRDMVIKRERDCKQCINYIKHK